MSRPPIIRATNLVKDYFVGVEPIHAVRDVSLTIDEGDFVAIMGPSGSGKSTFMNLLGALDTATSGTLAIDNQDLGSLDADALADLRNRKIGFVFQQFNLLPRADALDNVALPMLYRRGPKDDPKVRARASLDMVGLGDRMDHMPNQLSGGQQQRVAIARALVNEPRIILADEPTGALDTKTSHEIMDLLTDLNRQGITVILVTHEADVAACARRQIHFLDGKVTEDERIGAPPNKEQIA